MKKLLLFTGLTLIAFSNAAEAKPKFMGWLWWPSHWYNQDFQPYYEDAIGPHNSQWDWQDTMPEEDLWTPAKWIEASGGNGQQLVQKWFTADILREDYVKDGKARVVVGPNFYHLGGLDKERVMRTLDSVYHVTSKNSQMFYLEDFRTHKVVGIYSKDGLDLQ